MKWHIPDNEIAYLRELAKKQAEYAALPVMAERKKQWIDNNDGVAGTKPPFIIETRTFNRDFMPESIYKCTSEKGRWLEHKMLEQIRLHELINDDHVIQDALTINYFAPIDEFGLTIDREVIEDSQGVPCGYKFDHPIKDIKTDLEMLKPVTFSVDREQTFAYKAFLEDILDGILPVKIIGARAGSTMLTHRVVELMGMEAFFMAMYDAPDKVHELMSYLRDNSLKLSKWAESEGLLILNNGNDESFGSSYNFTQQLPKTEQADGEITLDNLWGSANSQETVGVAPAMFHEFCFPYYKAATEVFGRLYWGCCEAADPFWDDLKTLSNLSKVSISRWAKEAEMAEALKGTGIIFSRKPHPNFLGVDPVLNEDGWAEHIRTTLELTKDINTEFIVRDVYTVSGNLDNPRKATEIARQEIDKIYG